MGLEKDNLRLTECCLGLRCKVTEAENSNAILRGEMNLLRRKLCVYEAKECKMIVGFFTIDEEHRIQPVPLSKIREWALWFQTANRVVEQTTFFDGEALVTVSTVFLGVDHGLKTPILFEPMVFEGPHNGLTDRYATWEQAQAGHQNMLKKTGYETLHAKKPIP